MSSSTIKIPKPYGLTVKVLSGEFSGKSGKINGWGKGLYGVRMETGENTQVPMKDVEFLEDYNE